MSDYSYTQNAEDYFLDLLEMDKAALWADIGSTPADTTSELWQKKLNKIGREYSLSTRYALMRLLYCRAAGCSVFEGGLPAEDGEVVLMVKDKTFRFRDISMEHAETMSPEESRQYMECMQELALDQADSDPELNGKILSRAWYDEESANAAAESLLDTVPGNREKARRTYQRENKRLYKNRLTRQETFLLGHILGFSFQEMRWFLLRTQHEEENFRFNHSGDLIEAYGFLTGCSWQHVLSLKEQYSQRTCGLEKQEGFVRNTGWTRDISDSLPAKVESWSRYPESMDQEFLNWMTARAPGLDVPSRTAGRIYRNLAAAAYELATGKTELPEEEGFRDLVWDCLREPGESEAASRLLCEDGKLSSRQCKMVADTLMRINKNTAESPRGDNSAVWHVLHVRDDGRVYPAGGIVNTGRTRVADVLTGKVQAEKGDMLYLLWFTANQIWIDSAREDVDIICCRVLDFMEIARDLLDAAMLPEFYPPHPMEQSMLLAIVSGRDEENSPAVVYETMLEAVQDRRNRSAGSRRHDPEEKQRVVEFYRDHPELTLAECALMFEISPKTLSAWQKELTDQGIIE